MKQILRPENIRDRQTYAIIGAAMEVHRTLGTGFLEVVYQRALGIELRARDVPSEKEREIAVYYKETPLGVGYRADFVCFGNVLVELKALPRLTRTEEAQVVNYLVASNLSRAILLNFGTPSLEYKRFIGRPQDPQITQIHTDS
jgi:GxxExxY protein